VKGNYKCPVVGGGGSVEAWREKRKKRGKKKIKLTGESITICHRHKQNHTPIQPNG
jgi:hypothetical protein